MIKSLIFAVAALTVIASGEGRVTSVRERKINTTIWDEAGRLELSVMSQKNIYHRGDEFRLQVMLRNPSEKDVYVFGTLDWGYSASLMFHIRDSKGKEIVPREVLIHPQSRHLLTKAPTLNFVPTIFSALVISHH